MSLVPFGNANKRPLRDALLGAVAIVALAGAALENGAFSSTAALADTKQPSAGPASFADVVDRVKNSVVSVKVKLADGGEADADADDAAHAAFRAGQSVRPLLQAVRHAERRRRRRPDFQASASPDAGAGLGLFHFRRRLHRHQQSCRRPRHRSEGDDVGRQDARRQGHRHRPQDRSRAAQGQGRRGPTRLSPSPRRRRASATG